MPEPDPSTAAEASPPSPKTPAGAKRTALYPLHEAAGASFTDFAGYTMPLRYVSDLAEHHAVRRAAGLFDLSHMGEIEVTGQQAAELLDYALVSEVSAIQIGKAKYTMICGEDGGILDDLIVYRLEQERYMVVANAANTSVVLAALQHRGVGFTATVHDSVDDWALIAIQGPAAAATMAQVTDADLEGLRYYTILSAEVAGVPARLARTGYTGEDGFEVFCSPHDAVVIWDSLISAGAAHGVVPAGLACRDSLRLEAAMPLYGNELSAEISPYEAGLGRVVKLDKSSDFVGRQALQERSAVPVDMVRVGLRAEGRRAPRAGQEVLAAGQPVGRVTSGALSPTLGHPVAMAYVQRYLAEAGTTLDVDIRGHVVAAQVVPLPFYRRTQ
ncbi:glycine cleavage system aminomethyltransferase GcvT [Janibacter melonis]|uniref:glycine cleavage system aminomethyltransferase GcvT n=1 Tax=Janibacter melonis TaxID=262209 RepID=UPI001749492C|nr:glycine cleavage system aminomethyltransferase GcvT [Janibacter melonis]